MKAFELLTSLGKMRRYHQMAQAILAQYPLTVKHSRCVTIRYNIIFRVDAVEGVFALRISPDQHRTALQTRSEMQWLEAICAESDLSVACPLRTKDNRLLIEIEQEGITGKRNAVVMTWLYGTAIHQNLSEQTLRVFGQSIARLHRQSEHYQPDGEFMTFDDYQVDEWGDLSYLEGDHPLLTSEQQALFRETIADCMAHLEKLRENLPRLYLIHSDINLNNAIVYRRAVSLFDFDDCRWGHFVQDIAPSLQWVLARREYSDALLKGYTDIRPLPCSIADLEMALRHRVMWGLNFMMHYRANQEERLKLAIVQAEEAIHFKF